MASENTLPIVECTQIGVYPTSTQDGVIGRDFCYDWRRVQEAARPLGQNLDSYLTAPLARRLQQKKLKTPVTFWYAPAGDFFVVTVCSKATNVDFFDPLHGLRGYVEYGGNYLRPTARPLIHWDGSRVTRLHALEGRTSSPFLVADFGNGFGLSVSESDKDSYLEIQGDPAAHFEYTAIPCASPDVVPGSGGPLEVHHALCILRWP